MNNIDFLKKINGMVSDSGINDNAFFRAFKHQPMPLQVLGEAFQQYFYYIRTFPQILAGLSHRVDSEAVRMRLARTVVSELGDMKGSAHFQMFEDVLSSIGVTLEDHSVANHIPEADKLVSGLEEIFLSGPTNTAIGAHYVIEETGLPMIRNLYEGFRQYEGVTTESLSYFYLHLFIESQHVEWIADAVTDAAINDAARESIYQGAVKVLDLLGQFWQGLYNNYYADEKWLEKA